MNRISNNILTKILPLTVIVCGLLAYNFMTANWTPPTNTPPLDNAAAPIDVSSSSQIKLGGFGTGPLSVTGMVAVTGTTTINNNLLVNGLYGRFASQVRAAEYCNTTGANCFTPAQNNYRCVSVRETEAKPFVAGSNPRINCAAGNFTCMGNWCSRNGWDDATVEAACTGNFCVFSCQRSREVCGYY